MTKRKLDITFIFATLGLILIFAASASPIPTYVRMQEQFNISTSTISMTAVSYFVGCILALLVFSRISDFVGRKKVAVFTLLLSLTGLLLLINTRNGNMLLIARAIQGFSCGIGSSTLSVLIIESGSNKNENLVASITGSAVLLGLAIGGLMAGIVAQVLPDSRNLTYFILGTFLVITTIGMLFGVETTELKKGALKSLKPQINLPKNTFSIIIPAAGCFIATWSFGGYFQAFSATISKSVFNLDSPLIAAIILVSYMAPNIIGSNLSNRFKTEKGQLIGIVGFVLAICLMYVGIELGNMIFYLAFVILAGTMQGVAYSSSLNALLKRVIKSESTGLLSIVYMISYAGAGLPSFIAGKVSHTFNFYQITLGYVILVILVGIVVVLSLNNIRKKTI